jgi:hypothetical protein
LGGILGNKNPLQKFCKISAKFYCNRISITASSLAKGRKEGRKEVVKKKKTMKEQRPYIFLSLGVMNQYLLPW